MARRDVPPEPERVDDLEQKLNQARICLEKLDDTVEQKRQACEQKRRELKNKNVEKIGVTTRRDSEVRELESAHTLQDALTAQVGESTSKLNRLEAELKAAERELKAREDVLAKNRAALEQGPARVQDIRSDLVRKGDELKGLDIQAAAPGKELGELETEWRVLKDIPLRDAKQNERLKQLDSMIDETKGRFEQDQRAKKEKVAASAKLAKDLTDWERFLSNPPNLQSLEDKVLQAEIERGLLEDKASRERAELERVKRQLIATSTRITELEGSIPKLEAGLANLDTEIGTLTESLRSLEAERDESVEERKKLASDCRNMEMRLLARQHRETALGLTEASENRWSNLELGRQRDPISVLLGRMLREEPGLLDFWYVAAVGVKREKGRVMLQQEARDTYHQTLVHRGQLTPQELEQADQNSWVSPSWDGRDRGWRGVGVYFSPGLRARLSRMLWRRDDSLDPLLDSLSREQEEDLFPQEVRGRERAFAEHTPERRLSLAEAGLREARTDYVAALVDFNTNWYQRVPVEYRDRLENVCSEVVADGLPSDNDQPQPLFQIDDEKRWSRLLAEWKLYNDHPADGGASYDLPGFVETLRIQGGQRPLVQELVGVYERADFFNREITKRLGIGESAFEDQLPWLTALFTREVCRGGMEAEREAAARAYYDKHSREIWQGYPPAELGRVSEEAILDRFIVQDYPLLLEEINRASYFPMPVDESGEKSMAVKIAGDPALRQEAVEWLRTNSDPEDLSAAAAAYQSYLEQKMAPPAEPPKRRGLLQRLIKGEKVGIRPRPRP